MPSASSSPIAQRIWRLLITACFSVLASTGDGSSPGSPSSAPEEIVDLPTFTVTADRVLEPLKKWHYISLPGYEIVCNDSEHTLRMFTREFLLLQQAVKLVLPGAIAAKPDPTYVILCKDWESFGKLAPKQRIDPKSDISSSASFFLYDKERSAMIVNLEQYTTSARTEIRPDLFATLRRQYFRELLTRNLGNNAPYWLEEGLAQMLAELDFSTKWVEVGKMSKDGIIARYRARFQAQGFWTDSGYSRVSGGSFTSTLTPSAAPSDSDGMSDDALTDMLNNIGEDELSESTLTTPEDSTFKLEKPAPQTSSRTSETSPAGKTETKKPSSMMIPLADFLKVKDGREAGALSPHYSMQSYLFVHLGLYGQNQRFTRGFAKFVVRSSQEPVTEQLFKECFGHDYAKFRKILYLYLRYPDSKFFALSGTSKNPVLQEPVFEITEASDGDASRILGESLRLGGNFEQAVNRLIAAYIRGDRSPDLLAALGLAEYDAGQIQRAIKFLEAACKADTKRTRAYYTLGEILMTQFLAAKKDANATLTPEETALVHSPLRAGAKHTPLSQEYYHVLAQSWTKSSRRPTEGELKFMLGGAQTYPRDLALIYNLAAACYTHEYMESCRALVDHGLQYASTANARSAFQKLASALPAKSDASTGSAPIK
jgi:tetratricopeptide (TPR) repeat protein